VASERITLLDDPPSVYSVAVFHPVFDPARPRAPENVRGFTCEVFRVRAVAEHAIEASVRRGIQVLLVDADSAADRRVLFESASGLASAAPAGLSLDTVLQLADRRWRIVLSTTSGYGGGFQGPAWFSLLAGVTSGALLAVALSATRVIRRLRRQVRAAQQLGQYTLLEKLGEGAVGVVYKARHAMMRRPTAIKLLADESRIPQRLARFEREVQLTSELTHPNTIAIYDYGRTPEGVFYYAMEYVEGLTLEQLVELSGPVPAARMAHLLRQACGALAEAHAVGLIHRDIKPANLMIGKRGGIADFLKVMDFGLVKDIGVGPDGERPAAITESATIAVVGTPLYLAPEAIARPSEVDGRADLYALGAVAYYLLVGAPVFGGQTVVEVCSQHLHATPVPPSERAAQAIPAALEAVILRCLQKRPADRYASAEELAAALAGAAGSWTDADAWAWWKARGDALVQQVRAPAA
jgi:tRNA A-37 threonylcarbamoyl transferase component Bud32